MNKITIAYAPDDNYMNMTIVSMVSAIENNKNSEIEFLILYSVLSEKSITKLNNLENKYQNVKIRFVKIDEHDFDNLPMSKWVTVQAWFRVRIPDLCHDLDRVLYLDCDTMINGNLTELFELDLKDNYAAVVKDVWNVKAQTKRLKMQSDSYFNSGMMLMNCKKFREDKIFEKLKEYSVKYKKIIKFCDQDTLNKVIDTKKINLPPKYNYMDTWWRNHYVEYEGKDLTDYKEAEKSPIIVHLTGLKPDVKGCGNSMSGKWWEYAKMSEVYEEEKAKYDASAEPVHKEKFLQKIFNIKNEYRYKDKWKVITVLGLKIKIRLERAEKIFVIFNTAFIGDTLLNNTLVQNIKYFYPDSKVVFVVQPQFTDVAKYQAGVDDTVTFDKKRDNNLFGYLKFAKNFPYKNVFASFVIYSNERNLLLSRLIGAKHIITDAKSLLAKMLQTKEKYPKKNYLHKKDISTGLIEALTGKSILNLPIVYEPPIVQIPLDKNKQYIALVTTSKFKKKDMPEKFTAELINLINKSGKIPVLLGAGETAKEYVQNLKNINCTDFYNLVDKTDFVELANVLKACEGVISVDTGTMHFANALNVPTVAIFYLNDANQWAPQEGLYNSITLQNPDSADFVWDKMTEIINNKKD